MRGGQFVQLPRGLILALQVCLETVAVPNVVSNSSKEFVRLHDDVFSAALNEPKTLALRMS